MKNIIILYFLFLNLNIHAQLKADAGDNLYLCTTADSFELAPINTLRGYKMLGGNTTAKGGIPPYKYKWECKIKDNLLSHPYIYASDLLYDTSVPNPKIKIYQTNKIFKIYLTVIDSLDSIAKDSTTFFITSYSYFMGVIPFYKNKYDTAILNLNKTEFIKGGVSPKQYFWSPTNYLINPNTISPKVWDTSVHIYGYYIVDSAGCKSSYLETYDLQEIISSISGYNLKSNLIINFHNPITENSIFELNTTNISKIELFNSLGQKIHSQRSAEKLEIGKLIKDIGVYFIVLVDINDKMNVIKVQRE